MKYFQYYPTIQYGDTVISDFFKRFVISDTVLENTAYYEWYPVQDGETPESISLKFYGSSNYTWIVLLANGIQNPYYDWVLTDSDLFTFVQRKYGVGHENDVHHYEAYNDTELENGTWVAFNFVNKKTVTNLDHETTQNEKKRLIKIVLPSVIGSVETALKDFMAKAIPTS